MEVISCGNGTASKESEIFIAELIREIKEETGREVGYVIVNEAGASVYSASPLGAEEFPDYDVTARSAVSIARRLQDPLAELIKIDPKSIGVGQYQHDMNEKRLDSALSGVLEDCVNSVGVDLNTASVSLLRYVAGLNAAVAKNIVAYREENGKFTSRKQLLKVPKLGEKAYTQCAGFLRIDGGENILDNTAVHPESYAKAEKPPFPVFLHQRGRARPPHFRPQGAPQSIRNGQGGKGDRSRQGDPFGHRHRTHEAGQGHPRSAPRAHCSGRTSWASKI